MSINIFLVLLCQFTNGFSSVYTLVLSYVTQNMFPKKVSLKQNYLHHQCNTQFAERKKFLEATTVLCTFDFDLIRELATGAIKVCTTR
jgi:hypothetical protein